MSVSVRQIPLEEEYQKNTGIKASDVDKLRQWLKTQPHLPRDHITDLDLILCYHCCGRSFAVTKNVLDLNYTLRTHFTGLFKDRTVDHATERALNKTLLYFLPMRTKEGYRCFYASFLDSSTKNFIYVEIVRTTFAIFDLYQYEEGTWPGLIIIFDLKGMVLGHLAVLELQALQQLLYYLQEGLQMNLKGLHFFNAPSFMDKLMMLIKPFTKNSLLDLMHIHPTGSNSLEEFYPVTALPKEAGGSFKSAFDCRDEILMKLKSSLDFFAEENKKRVVESLRPGKPKTVSDIFGGVEGSFKKLDID